MLRPGGRLAVLEVDAPTSPALARRLRRLVHQGGARCSGRRSRTARPTATCPRSVAYLPPAPVLRRMLLDAGFSAVGIRPLAGGLSQLVVATRAGAPVTAASALHARTVPLEYGPDALQFDGSPTVLFDRPGLTLVGWGTAQLVEAAEAAAALAAIPCDDAVRRPRLGRRRARARCPSPAPWPATSSSPASPWASPATPTASPGAGPPRSGRPTRRCPTPTSSSTPSSGSTARRPRRPPSDRGVAAG